MILSIPDPVGERQWVTGELPTLQAKVEIEKRITKVDPTLSNVHH